MKNIIEISDLSKSFSDGRSDRVILDHCSLTVPESQLTALVGKSGSGKTTLLNIIGGLEKADSGTVLVDNIELSDMRETDLDNYRSRYIGFIFQSYEILNDFTVEENIRFISDLTGRRQTKRFMDSLLDELHLTDLRDHYPSQLSGGEKQRTAIARALHTAPSIILADEPTGNLDRISSQEVFDLLKNCSRIHQQTILMVTHDLSLAKQADNILILEDGKVTRYGEN